MAGIHLMSVVLANDLPPFDPHRGDTGSLTHGQFFQALIQNLMHKSVKVYRAAAVVVGMALHLLSDEDRTQVVKRLTEVLSELVKRTGSTYDNDERKRRPRWTCSCIFCACSSSFFSHAFFLMIFFFLLVLLHPVQTSF